MKKVQGNDSFQRINYLYQISKLMSEKNPVLSAYYGNLIINVAKKNVLKLHPDLKRQICKKCRCTIINNVPSQDKIRKRKSHKLKYIERSCKICGMNKCLPVPSKRRDARVWPEKPEAVVEVISL